MSESRAPDLTVLPTSSMRIPPAFAHLTQSPFPPVPVDSYHVFIGEGILSQLAQSIRSLSPAARYILVSDSNVFPLYGESLVRSFQEAKLEIQSFVIPPGEQSKIRETKAMIEDRMLSQSCGRDTTMLALGGGVIGDLTGFIASTYMRGIPYIQLPSSFLAMVDSSIGGKTGIDAPVGKNLIGAFHRPAAVIVDTTLLKTLPVRELCNGMAESIKAGAIADESLFSLIENHADRILAFDTAVLTEIIHRSVIIKANVVRLDEREGGIRSILNFGHSIGHAIEAIMQPSLLHGECITIGMIEEAILARSLGYLTSSSIRRLDNCVTAFKLPTRIPSRCSPQALIEKMGVDKKNKNGRKEIVILTGIGAIRANPYTTTVSDDDLLSLLCRDISIVPSQSSPHGTVAVPGSKSLSNRILLMAAMGRGQCLIRGLLHSADTQVMLDSLRELGVKFHWEENGELLVMTGSAGRLAVPSKTLFLNNAGTAARFLTTLCTCVSSGSVTLTGNERMKQRPIGDLVDALIANGCRINYHGAQGCFPLTIESVGGFPGGEIRLRANISSQYVSSILLSAPHALKPVTLILDDSAGGVVSKPFIDMSIDLMKHFNISVSETAANTYTIAQGSYDNPSDVIVEGDASSATYPLALAAISEGQSVTVSNVGSRSLQGDSKFYTVLERMGCTVSQTEMTTTVIGPPSLSMLRGIDIDMDAMTDTFMTLAVVAALATGITRITNIANQRVKECNRLAVMVEELTKCGIDCHELDTGMEIVGLAGQLPSKPLSNVRIDCHDDHRIAMSFSILATKITGIIINDKRCVDKTYPEYWDHLQRHLHVTHRPPTTASATSGSDSGASLASRRSVLIIGMRGAGKTTLGHFAAAQLGRRFIDIDTEIERAIGHSIREYVVSNGWEAFRALELRTIEAMMAGDDGTSVISCGGGIVETERVRSMLVNHHHAFHCVWLDRDIDDIVQYLASDSTRPDFDARAVYQKRQPYYQHCSTHVFDIVKGDSDWKSIEKDFLFFLRNILGLTNTRVIGGQSFFLSLTFPDIRTALTNFSVLTQGIDAIELRVDLLASLSPPYVRQTIALIRRHSPLPIIFTVRTTSQGGMFAGSETEMFELLTLGQKLGCEMIDVESNSSTQLIQSFTERCLTSKLIGSHHCVGSNGGTEAEIRSLINQCALQGKADILKLVITAATEADAVRFMNLINEIKKSQSKPMIALAMGSKGKVSRVFNSFLTPVTHELMPTAAAPGQMTVKAIMEARLSLGLVDRKEFHLFGSPITHSPSPLLHNTAFELLSLPNHYNKIDTSDVNDVSEAISKPSFGGASVTIPLKEKVAPLLAAVSDSARAIGSINTIIRRSDGSLYGDNTDWIGMLRPLQSTLTTVNSAVDVAVVVGAGGTARAAIYAAVQLGFRLSNILVHNPRTPEKAETLAKEFGVASVNPLTYSQIQAVSQQPSPAVRAVLSTVPSASNFTLDETLSAISSLVVLDASYLPAETALTSQVKQRSATVIKGLDMLLEQGLAQFELWTGRSRVLVEQVVNQKVRDAYHQQWVAGAPTSANGNGTNGSNGHS